MPFNSSALDLEFIDGVHWKLLRPCVYSGKFWRGVIPRGFITDFASVPRILWNVLPPTGRYGPAAVVHDYLYTIQAGKEKADRTFNEAMESLGVGRVTRLTMYYAVKVFGGPAYRNHALPQQRVLRSV